MTRLGTRAFTALTDLFKLQDNTSLGELDLRIASAVFPLQNVLVASVGRYSRFVKTVAATVGANPNSSLARPRSTGDWDSIFTSDGDGLAVPGGQMGHAMFLIGAGVFTASGAQWTSSAYIQDDGTVQFPIQEWSSQDSGRASRRARASFYGDFPNPPFEMKTLGNFVQKFESVVTGAHDVTLIIDVLSGPPGLFGAPRGGS